MNETPAHLVNDVLPHMPVRPWVPMIAPTPADQFYGVAVRTRRYFTAPPGRATVHHGR